MRSSFRYWFGRHDLLLQMTSKSKKLKALLVLLLLVLVFALALLWRGGQPAAEGSPTSAGGKVQGAEQAAAPASASAAARPGTDARPKQAVSPLVPRPIPDIRTSLLGQARQVVDKGLAGVDEAAKQDLLSRMTALEADAVSGRASGHPAILMGLAAFSRELDQLGAYDESAWKTEAAAYLEKRLAEVDALADGDSALALRERWWREFTRDDAPEAILLRYVDNSTTKENLRGGLASLIRLLNPPAK